MPEPAAFDRSFALLGSGGRYVIMDGRTLEGVRRPLNPLLILLGRLFAAADIRRESWRLLQSRAGDFRTIYFLGGYVFVASGTKP